MLVLSILCTVLIAYALWHLIKLTLWSIRVIKMTANIPGPKPLPIIGNALLLAKISSEKDYYDFIQYFSEKYQNEDRIYKLWIGPKLVIALGHHKHIEKALSSQYTNEKEDHIYKYFRLTASGLLGTNGKPWEELRQPLNEVFTKILVKSNTKLFHEKSLVLCKVLDKFAKSGEMFNIRQYLLNLAMDTLSISNFGYNLNELERERYSLLKHFCRVMDITYSMVFNLPYNVCLPYAKISPIGQELKRCSKTIWNLCTEMLEARKAVKKSLGEGLDEKPKLFADAVLQIGKRDKLSLDDTSKLIVDFVMGGTEAPSAMSSIAMLLLAMYPEHQEAVYKEQVDILGEDPKVGPTWEQLSQMTYLSRVLKETLRIYCPPLIVRSVTTDIDLGDYILPKGSTACFCMYALHRDPQVWSHPNEFYPDHFLPDEVASRPKAAFLPYGTGARMCPGNTYTMTSMKTAMSVLVRKYKFETDLKLEDLKYKVSLLIEIANGCMVRIKPRNV